MKNFAKIFIFMIFSLLFFSATNTSNAQVPSETCHLPISKLLFLQPSCLTSTELRQISQEKKTFNQYLSKAKKCYETAANKTYTSAMEALERLDDEDTRMEP